MGVNFEQITALVLKIAAQMNSETPGKMSSPISVRNRSLEDDQWSAKSALSRPRLI